MSAGTEDVVGVGIGVAPAGGLGVEGVEEEQAPLFRCSDRCGSDSGDGALTEFLSVAFRTSGGETIEKRKGGRRLAAAWRKGG